MNNSLVLHTIISKTIHELSQFIGNPKNLPKWTVHRALFNKNEDWFEIRKWKNQLVDAELKVVIQTNQDSKTFIAFNWLFPDNSGYEVLFELSSISATQTQVLTQLPKGLSEERLQKMKEVVKTELAILKAIHEKQTSHIPTTYWHTLQSYHLFLYQ